MTSLQKVIKYGAMAFGFYLVFVIISAIVFGITTIFGISFGINTYKSLNNENSEIPSFTQSFEDVNSLDIELDVSKLYIKKGNEFKVEVDKPTNKFYCKMNQDTLKIKDNRSKVGLFNFSDDVVPEITIYIPENQELDKIELDAGVNETYIEKLVADKVDIETGVGKFIADEINTDILKIEGGAGETKIQNSNVRELKLDAGVGKFVINSKILDEAQIDAGVGQLIVNLEGNKDDYKVKTSTGLGNLLVDGKKASDEQIIGDGNCYVKVEAGVGEVQVNFIKNNI